MTIKDRLKILIDSLGLSLKEVSRRTGIPYPTLLQYLGGKRSPVPENLQKIAIHLNVNLNWLLTGEGPMFMQKKECPVEVPPGSVLEKILLILKDMDEEKQREILKHIEEKKLLQELIEEHKRRRQAADS